MSNLDGSRAGCSSSLENTAQHRRELGLGKYLSSAHYKADMAVRHS
jgi:hypothetical protein